MLLYEFSSEKEDKKTNKKNYIKGVGSIGAGAYVGQQTVRSGVPRLLGVRLESHSTSRKNAKDILKNGGWLDPNLSGTKSTSILNDLNEIGLGTDSKWANNKVYITGIHKDAKNLGNPLSNVLFRMDQRRGYRAQGEIDWNKLDRDAENDPTVKRARDIWEKSKSEYSEKNYKQTKLGVKQVKRIQETAKNLIIPGKGRSLYVGGTDEFFNSNFKPDVDDLRAMYSDKKVRVFGNRASATINALKKGGLKGVISNPKRNLAGAAMLIGGGLLTKKLVDNGIKELSDGKVEAHRRKGKDGKMFAVRAFQRKLHNR